MDGRFGFVKNLKPQKLLTMEEGNEPGGFDIVLANPPYLRAEVVKQMFGDAYKDNLVRIYPEAYVKTADIYVACYSRAHQLLRLDGAGCFISSNKWLRAGYGEKLRQHLLDKQAFRLVVDFGELPVFEAAATFPAIFLWQKQQRSSAATAWATVKDLKACYEEGVREHVSRISVQVPATNFSAGAPRLATGANADRRQKMEKSGPRLGDVVKGKILYGIKTGLNEAFIIDREMRDSLIAEDKNSAEIIKPNLPGDHVRRYEIHFRDLYLIWTYIGVPIKKYPAIFRHLKKFQNSAEKRSDQGAQWWELRPCDYYDAFSKPKIIYPDIGKEPRFVLDSSGYFLETTAFLIPVADWYLLGVLNSHPAFEFMKSRASVVGDEDKGGRVRLKTILEFGKFYRN